MGFAIVLIAFLLLPTILPHLVWFGGGGVSHKMGILESMSLKKRCFSRMVPGPRSKGVSRNRQDGISK